MINRQIFIRITPVTHEGGRVRVDCTEYSIIKMCELNEKIHYYNKEEACLRSLEVINKAPCDDNK